MHLIKAIEYALRLSLRLDITTYREQY